MKIFLAYFFICANCIAQRYAFVNYTPKDGLVNNRARFMFQDSKGKLFISTYGGLSIYDGSRFTNYTTDNGLAASLINDIIEMGDDSLWIVPNTNQIQCMVHGVIKNFYTADNFYPVINQLIKCSDGFFYAIADEGLFRFEKNRFEKILLLDTAGKDPVKNLAHATEVGGILFMSTDPNIREYPGSGVLIAYNLHTKKTLISENKLQVFFIAATPDSNVLVSTQKNIFKIDRSYLDQGKIEFADAIAQYHIPENTGGAHIFFDSQHNLWLLNYKGVLKIDKNGNTRLYTSQNGLSEDIQESIFEDRENIIWLMGAHTGISKIINQQLEIYSMVEQNFHANDLYADGGSDSVWMYDALHNNILLHYGNADNVFTGAKNSSYLKIFCFRQSVYLIKAWEVYKVNFEKQHNHFTTSLLYNDSNLSNGISCILHDEAGNIIAVSDKAVAILQNGKIIKHQLDYLADQAVLANNYLWIATRARKLFLFKINANNPDNYLQLLNVYSSQLSNIGPRSITADKKGNVWIGTRDHGLLCFSFQNNNLQLKTQLTTKDGLSENFINYLHCDAANNVWARSPAGLDKIIIKNGKYYVENITQSNNIFQQVHKIFTTQNGTHWILTADGIIRLDADSPNENRYSPKLLFTQIKAGDSAIFNAQKPPELNSSQNNISFSVAAPTFYDEKQTRFSYLLSGSNNNKWSLPSTQSEINFINLEPGSYTLKIKAIFLSGRYDTQNAEYSFIILPPWWQSWWFRAIAIVAVIAIIFFTVVNYYNRKFEKQRSSLEKQQAIEKERTRIATDMHDDLGAGLSRIKFLSEIIGIKKQQKQPIEEDIIKITEYSNEMIGKMGEIVWALNEKNDSLSDLLAYTRAYSTEYLSQNGIACKISAPDNFPAIMVSGEFRRNIYLVVKEALHNIVKHAYASNVNISFKITHLLTIILHDDGIGFDANNIRPFSNGLANMKKRMAETGGRMEIKKENGTEVILTVLLPQ